MIGLLELEKRAWMTESERKRFFQLLDVPDHLIHEFTFTKAFSEDIDEQMHTTESFRPFITFPKWLKKRIKYRLKQTSDPFKSKFQFFVERIIANE